MSKLTQAQVPANPVHPLGLPVRVIRSSRRTKTIGIEVLEAEIRVRAPLSTTPEQINQVLTKQHQWIQATIAKQRLLTAEQTATSDWKHHLLYQGKPLTLTYELASVWSILKRDDDLIVSGPRDEEQDLHSIVIHWYRREAEREIPKRLKEWAKRLNAVYGDVRIKDQKSRWGSCSSRRNLNFNWRLVCTPTSVLDYVIVHELSHLWEMNHSQSFWNRVERVLPNYRAERDWLKQNGKLLYF